MTKGVLIFARPVQVHPPALALVTFVESCALTSVLLVMAGTPVAETMRATVVIGLQAVSGVCIVHFALRQRRISTPELLGLGSVFGALAFIVGYQALLLANAQDLAWWIVPATSFVLMLVAPRQRVTLSLGTPTRVLAGLAILATGAWLLASMWVRNPLHFEGWISYFVDLSFHEAAAQGLALSGPDQTTFLAGFPFDYHWFANAWAGAISHSADLSPYVALSRGLYVYALIAGASLAWAWGSRLSTSRYAGPFAALALVGVTSLGMGITYSYSTLLVDTSPTHTFAVPLAIATSLIATEYVRGRLNRGAVVLLAILGGALLGSRAPLAMVLLFAATGLVLAHLVRRSVDEVKRAAIAITGLGLGMVPVYLMVVRPKYPELGSGQLSISPNAEMTNVYGLIPYTGPGGVLLAVLAVVAGVAAGWSGLLVLASVYRRRLVTPLAWCSSAAMAALLGVFLLSQVGRSQVSFLWAGAAVILPASGAGVAEGWRIVGARSPRLPLILGIIGISLGVAAVITTELTRPLWFGGYLRWGTAVGPWIIAGSIALMIGRRFMGREPRSRSVSVSVAAIMLLSASTAADIVGSTWRTLGTSAEASPQTPIAINHDHFAAAQWIRSNVSGRDGLLATNRQCDVLGDVPPSCVSTSFITSALTGRPTLIEGFSYSIPAMPRWAIDRAESSYDIGARPTPQVAEYLWQQGVRWVWIDHLLQPTDAWRNFGKVVFESPTVSLLELGAPKAH